MTLFERESKLLEESWACHKRESLKNYLVSGFHDPRIHIQSILTRHFLIKQLFGDAFRELMREEIAFAVEINEEIRVLEEEAKLRRDALIAHTLDVRHPDLKKNVVRLEEHLSEERMNTLQREWLQALSGKTIAPIRVVEPACGSANDYRFLHTFGVAPFLDYTGFDIAKPNIENACELFPKVSFKEANLLDLSLPEGSFDYLFVHDLFEHLSLEALDYALEQAGKLVRRGMALAFFNMSDAPTHHIQPVRKYHWNLLSRRKIEHFFKERGWGVEVIEVTTLLAEEYDYHDYYNKYAYTFIVQKKPYPRHLKFS